MSKSIAEFNNSYHIDLNDNLQAEVNDGELILFFNSADAREIQDMHRHLSTMLEQFDLTTIQRDIIQEKFWDMIERRTLANLIFGKEEHKL